MKVGTKVKIKDNAMSRAWGIANEVGIVTGPDPGGHNDKVVAVKLDTRDKAICEAGIHVDHLEPLVDITSEVQFGAPDDGYLPLMKCKCGEEFDYWEFVLSIYPKDPAVCPKCGRRMFFKQMITVYEVVEKEFVKRTEGS